MPGDDQIERWWLGANHSSIIRRATLFGPAARHLAACFVDKLPFNVMRFSRWLLASHHLTWPICRLIHRICTQCTGDGECHIKMPRKAALFKRLWENHAVNKNHTHVKLDSNNLQLILPNSLYDFEHQHVDFNNLTQAVRPSRISDFWISWKQLTF